MEATLTRTDEHRPSAINPADYKFVGFERLNFGDFGDFGIIRAYREMIRKHMAETGGTYSRHQHGGNCHICGAHAIYTALFYHKPTNSYIRTGLECAEKLECYGAEAFRREVRVALEQQAGKRKAQAVLEQAGIGQAWTIYTAKPAETDRREEQILRDIVGKLVQWGSISEAQTNFLRKLVDAIARRPEIDAKRAAETAAAAPVPVTDKRITICGKLLSRRANDFGIKMLIQHADGWKLWGTQPAAFHTAVVGDTVEFAAKIKPSDRDPKFGFFSRPTKARIVN